MKKLLLNLKTLLVVVLLGMGVNAWGGEKSTIYSKALSGWASSDITASNSTFTAGKWTPSQTGDSNKGLWTSTETGLMTRCRNNTVTGTLTFNRTANTIVTIDAVWNVGDTRNGKSEHQNGYNQYTYFQYGDLLIATCLDNRSTDYAYTINGVKKTFSNVTAGCLLNTDLTIHLVVNSVDGVISEFYIKNGETTFAQYSDLDETNNTFAGGADYDKVITKSYNNVSSTNAYNYLKSLTVQQETQDVPTASVTFKYEDTEGNSLSSYKADQVQSDVAQGTTISTLISSYTETFYNGTSNKYVYSGSYVVEGNYTTVQSGGNTVTLKFTDYPATAYTVKAQVGGEDLMTIASGTAFLDGSTTANYSKYIKSGGTWYETTSPYGIAVTSASPKVTYTASDISYFYEYEGLSGTRYTDDSNAYSGGQRARLGKGATLSSAEAITGGFYTLKAVWGNDNNTTNYVYVSTIKDEVATATGQSIEGTNKSSGTAELTVRIPDGASIAFVNNDADNNSNVRIDYVTLTYLAPLSVSATIGDKGYATFSSTYALDFTDVTEATAYIATDKSGSNIKMQSVTGTVAANTGLVLKSANGGATSFTIPTATSGTNYNPTSDPKNYLFAINSNYNLGIGTEGTNYVLSVQNDKVVFAPITSNDHKAPVTAGHAALWLPTAVAAQARSLSMSFEDDETTGISNLTPTLSEGEGAVYNLNGQRVDAPKKGLYIKNGKKVIVK